MTDPFKPGFSQKPVITTEEQKSIEELMAMISQDEFMTYTISLAAQGALKHEEPDFDFDKLPEVPKNKRLEFLLHYAKNTDKVYTFLKNRIDEIEEADTEPIEVDVKPGNGKEFPRGQFIQLLSNELQAQARSFELERGVRFSIFQQLYDEIRHGLNETEITTDEARALYNEAIDDAGKHMGNPNRIQPVVDDLKRRNLFTFKRIEKRGIELFNTAF